MRTGNNRSGEYDASGNPRCGAQVEGAEIGVLRSAEQLLCSGRVRRLVMEYKPERCGNLKMRAP